MYAAMHACKLMLICIYLPGCSGEIRLMQMSPVEPKLMQSLHRPCRRLVVSRHESEKRPRAKKMRARSKQNKTTPGVDLSNAPSSPIPKVCANKG